MARHSSSKCRATKRRAHATHQGSDRGIPAANTRCSAGLSAPRLVPSRADQAGYADSSGSSGSGRGSPTSCSRRKALVTALVVTTPRSNLPSAAIHTELRPDDVAKAVPPEQHNNPEQHNPDDEDLWLVAPPRQSGDSPPDVLTAHTNHLQDGCQNSPINTNKSAVQDRCDCECDDRGHAPRRSRRSRARATVSIRRCSHAGCSLGR
jgi:hypothetical protein